MSAESAEPMGVETTTEAVERLAQLLEVAYSQHSAATLRALLAEREAMRKLIGDHNAGCIASCEATKGPHHCDAYLSRGRAACPECPRDWMIETP